MTMSTLQRDPGALMQPSLSLQFAVSNEARPVPIGPIQAKPKETTWDCSYVESSPSYAGAPVASG